jgi:hypothetical protein
MDLQLNLPTNFSKVMAGPSSNVSTATFLLLSHQMVVRRLPSRNSSLNELALSDTPIRNTSVDLILFVGYPHSPILTISPPLQ